MSDAPITALGLVRAKPGKERELGRRMAALLEPTRAERGCIAYDIFQSIDDAAVWVLIESWRSVADLDAHIGTEHMAAFLAQSHEVLHHAPDNFRLRRVPAAANVLEDMQ
jgi:quinol monooxygenase YgiN